MNALQPPPASTRPIPVTNPPPDEAVVPVASLSCPGQHPARLDWSAEDLCRHTLFVGTTGSGKTTTLNQLLRDLIRHQAESPEAKIGLLIVDSKRDDTVAKVKAWAEEAGRAEDVVVLAPGSSWGYHPFLELTDLRALESVTAKVASTARYMGRENGFFTDANERMIEVALTVLLVTGGVASLADALLFLGDFLLSPDLVPREARDRADLFEGKLQHVGPRLSRETRQRLLQVQHEVRAWLRPADGRLKDNIVAGLANTLKAFRSTAMQDYLALRGRRAFDPATILTEGKIAILSVDAGGEPEISRTLIRLLKADYFRLLQARRLAARSEARLTGIVLDEYPLAVTAGDGRFSDVTQLQTIRSKRGFLVAATQGFNSLDLVVGEPARNALLANLNSLLLFQSNEEAVQRFAADHFRSQATDILGCAADALEGSRIGTGPRRSCRPARTARPRDAFALNRLACGEAFVSLANGRTYAQPLRLEPLHFNGPAEATVARPSCDPEMTLLQQWSPPASDRPFDQGDEMDPDEIWDRHVRA